MMTFIKALELAKKWVELISNGSCQILEEYTIDKPYGWIFFWNAKNYDPHDPLTWMAGNAPIIVDRIDGELRVTGTAGSLEHYIDKYEAMLPPARLQMTPEKHT
jgi:hypothetical protein